MSSSPWPRTRRLRRALPWVLYAAAALALVPLARIATGFGASPAVAEARRLTLSCPRTSHRLWVKEVLVAPGEAVAAGQVLARMATDEVDLELATARGKLEGLDLAGVRASLAVERLAAEQQHDHSELAELELAIAKESALVADHLVDRKYLGELQRRRAGLEARARELEGALQQAQRGAPGDRRPRAADPGARAAAESARDQVRLLEALRDRLELRAPAAGRVEAVLLRPGEVATADGAVLTMVEERPQSAIAYVDERWADRVRAGDRVKLAAHNGAGPRVEGRVTALGPAIVELPVRFRLVHTVPRYGRVAYLQLDAPAFLPGEALEATFVPGPRGDAP